MEEQGARRFHPQCRGAYVGREHEGSPKRSPKNIGGNTRVIETIKVDSLSDNSYALGSEESGRCAVIDSVREFEQLPGGGHCAGLPLVLHSNEIVCLVSMYDRAYARINKGHSTLPIRPIWR